DVVIDLVTNSERRAAVARRRLHKHAAKRRMQQNLSVHHRVVGHAARQSQVSQARLLMQKTQYMERDFFEPQLKTRGNDLLALRQRCSRYARRTKAPRKFIGKDSPDHGRTAVPGHLDTFGMMPEALEIQTKLSVVFGADDVTKLIDVAWLAVRRQAHHLAFVPVMRKAQKLRRGRIDDAGRVRVLDLAQNVDRLPCSLGPHS